MAVVVDLSGNTVEVGTCHTVVVGVVVGVAVDVSGKAGVDSKVRYPSQVVLEVPDAAVDAARAGPEIYWIPGLVPD